MAPRKRRPKPSRATRDATDALFRPLQFPTRASWDAYLDQRAKEREEFETERAQERAALERLQVPEESVEAVLGELDTPVGEADA